MVTWLDDRADPNAIFAQRITASGAAQWAVNGVPAGLVYAERPFSFVHRGTEGGFLVTWWDSAPIFGSEMLPVLAQKLDVNGAPLCAAGTSGPNVVFKRGNGLFARAITVPAPLQLTSFVSSGNHELSFTLSGGVPGRAYDVLRSARLAPFTDGAWTVVGTVQPGETWTDTEPPLPHAFYGARDPSP